MRTRLFAHHLLSLLIGLSLMLTSAAPAVQAQEGGPVWLPFVGRGTTPYLPAIYSSVLESICAHPYNRS